MNKDQKEFRKLAREAIKLFRKEKWDASIVAWNKIISLLQDDLIKASVYTRRGYAKDKADDHEGAIADHDRAIEIRPQYAKAYSNRGNAKGGTGDREDAIADYDRAIEINPQYATAYYNRGNTKRNMGDNEGALADYDRALEIRPQYAKAYNNRGNAKSGMGDHRGALADYDRALEINPQHPMVYSNRGGTKSDMGDYEGALDDFDRALKIDPEHKNAIRNRAITLSMRRETQKGGKKIEEQLRAQQKQFDLTMQKQLRAQQEKFDRSMREQLQTQQEKFESSMQKQLQAQQEKFDLKSQEAIKQKTEAWESANRDIIAALDYKKNLDESNKKLEKAEGRVRFWMPVLTGASALAFISIAFFHFDINKPFSVLPLVAMVSLALSTLIWHIRMLNLDKHKCWALREDALTNLTLARIITSTGLRKELLERLFDHHTKRSSANDSKHADTDGGIFVSTHDIVKEFVKRIKPGGKGGD